MDKYKLYIVGLLLTLSQVAVGQKTTPLDENTIVAKIPFELTEANNISVKAILNKADTVYLMFHTAVTSLSLIEASTASLKSINWNNEYDVQSWGGESSARFSENNSVEIGELAWDSISIWEDKYSGPQTDGKFGLDFFEGKVLEIDFDNNLLIIHAKLPSKVEAFEKFSLTFDNDLMFIEGLSVVGGMNYSNKFLIHSGYGGTILYDDKFVETSKIGEQLEVIEESELKDSYGNVLKTKKAILPIFRLGKTELKDIPVGFFEGAIANQKMSVLGGNVLKRFNLIIDANRENIYLKENQLIDLTFLKISN